MYPIIHHWKINYGNFHGIFLPVPYTADEWLRKKSNNFYIFSNLISIRLHKNQIIWAYWISWLFQLLDLSGPWPWWSASVHSIFTNLKQFALILFLLLFGIVTSINWKSEQHLWKEFKGATKLYFTHYSCLVIVLINTASCGSSFSTVSFRKLAFRLSVFSLNQDLKRCVVMLCNFGM